ncbi:CPBP family intramembrane glutamic endopeptidase [Bacteroides acidifaciens]|uniref:CPBP family intramembrane metalloprotease n=1 Tax=Bacteroides acidifaciens TaxID=85831 RepID=A0A4S2B161_9BACE|nr:type II CAAX endopeptidase family protein [Bacteroides acidifaciens]MCR1999964.1 CPBP family intramembrane metalloprotease [Bacteroides acidifaciens]MCR2004324.1 CPBP family intramembrane metalloprotease [Bacteroides acidifaciens]TGY07511.1 CPBP family intramembrane metalloprotease [Bacteroides acidifaciens]
MAADNIVEKKEPERLPVWACIPLFIVVFFVCMGLYGILAQGFLSLVLGVEARHPGMVGYILLEGGMLLAVLTAAVIMLRLERRPFSDLGLSVKGHAKGLWYGFLMAVLLYLVGFGLSLVMGEVEVSGFQFRPLDLLGALLFFGLVALFEEILMRGYILGHLLHTRLNKFLSLFISAALFAFLHIFNPEIAFLPMINLVLAGMLLGASYLYTRNLCFPLSLHFFWNWIQGPVLGYQVSGNNFMSTMLKLHMPEENVLNGGAFGFEGSLICTVLMIVCTILIVWWGEKRKTISLETPQSC